MKRLSMVMMALGLAMAATACEKSKASDETSTTVTTKTKTESKTPGSSSTSETTTVTKTTEPGTGGDIGVAACDEYLRKMTDCQARAVEPAAAAMKDATAALKKTWKQAAATSGGELALAGTCKDSLLAARTAYASIGCTF